MIGSHLFYGGKKYYVNTKTKQDILKLDIHPIERVYYTFNMIIDESIPDYYAKIKESGKLIRVYKFIPHYKRKLRDIFKQFTID